jgi:hypothetical protein
MRIVVVMYQNWFFDFFEKHDYILQPILGFLSMMISNLKEAKLELT